MGTACSVKQPVCLVVIDGWGISDKKHGNAILNGHTPVMDRLCSTNSTTILTHGPHVGLPEGLLGNSKVGHLNIGAGRVVDQDIVRINSAMKNGDILKNEAVINACENAKSKNGRLHLLGLVSDGGNQSHIDHLFGLIRAVKHHKVPECFVQFFSDVRHDTEPRSGLGFVEKLVDFFQEEQYGRLATIMGRYYAMDRDGRWERLKIAYEALIAGRGEKTTLDEVLNLIHKRDIKDSLHLLQSNDSFMKPIILEEDGLIKENDTLIFINIRADRMREITEAIGGTRHFETDVTHPIGLHISCMTQYKEAFTFPILFPPVRMKNVLAEWLSSLGLPQYHCAETEKYAHVTYFLNGGREAAFDMEDRCMEPSPKEVQTYDHKPEMNCMGVANKMVEVLGRKKYPFVMCNFAPPDMVGHTGFYDAAVEACQATDKAVGLVEEACKANGYILMVTSDHGNAEEMIRETGERHKAHTFNPVPFTSTGTRRFREKLHKNPERKAALCDVAPSILDIMGLPKPGEMTGETLME